MCYVKIPYLLFFLSLKLNYCSLGILGRHFFKKKKPTKQTKKNHDGYQAMVFLLYQSYFYSLENK